MKIKTHNIFNIGVLTYIGAFLTVPLYSLISAILISFPANEVIDKYGHEKNGLGIPVRTYKTHSPIRAFVWGMLPAVIFFTIVYYFRNRFNLMIPYFILIQGLLSGELHLLLDLPTEGGIFINKKRFALGHFAYNNPLLNFLGIIIGLFLIYISFGGSYEEVYRVFKHIVVIFKRIV